MTVGDRVRIIVGGTPYEGEVVELFTAGNPGGVGVWRERQRVRVRFEDHGEWYLTQRDQDQVQPVTQPSLFGAIR